MVLIMLTLVDGILQLILLLLKKYIYKVDRLLLGQGKMCLLPRLFIVRLNEP